MPRAKSTTTKKRSTAPKSVKSARVSSDELQADSSRESLSGKSSSLPFRLKRSYLLIFIIAALAIVLLYIFRGLFVVAMVNGEPVTRLDVVRELEAQGGKQVSESLITQKLIRQKARSEGITVTQDEINAEIQTLEKLYQEQGQDLNQVLELRGMTRDGLVEQIELKLLLDKLIGQPEVTDEEVAAFIEQNNEAYGGTLTEEDVRQQLMDQKFNEQSTEYISNLQQEANIQFFVEY